MMVSLKQKFFYGETSFALWDIVSKAIGLLNTFFILKSLSLYEYGVFQLLLSGYAFISNFTSPAGNAVGNDISRLIGERREPEAKKLFWEYNRLRILGGGILCLVAFFGSYLFLFKYDYNFIINLQLLAVIMMLEILFTTLKAVLRLRLFFGQVASRSTFYKVAQLIFLSASYFFFNLGTTEVLWSMIAGSLLSSLLLVPVVARAYGPWRGLAMSNQKFLIPKLKSQGKWEIFSVGFSKSSTYFQPWITKILINTEAVAIFSIAQTMLGTIYSFFPTKTISALVPLKMEDKELIQRVYTIAVKYLVFFGVACGLVALVLSGPVIRQFFEQYTVSLPYFYALLPIIPVTAASLVTSAFLVAHRKQKFLFLEKILKSAIGIPLYFILLPLFDIWGLVAQSLIVSVVLFSVMYFYTVKWQVGIKLELRRILSFGAEDREFVKKFMESTVNFIKLKFRFLRNNLT